MGKTDDDKAYERGVHDGLKGDGLDDALQEGSKAFDLTGRTGEIYSKGYDFGKEHRNDSSSDSSSSSSESSSSGCYLTTVSVNAMGLLDNCYELSVLRKFRDSVLLTTPKGRRAVREYYRIAPEILEAVEERGRRRAQNVWHSIFKDIRKAVFMVTRGDFEGAFQHYRQITTNMKEKYLA